jgi:hypothetical protein
MGRHQLGRDLDAEPVRVVVAFLGALTGEFRSFRGCPRGKSDSANGTPVAVGRLSPFGRVRRKIDRKEPVDLGVRHEVGQSSEVAL